MKNFDYYVALITAIATEEAGVMHMYKDWKPLNLEGEIVRNTMKRRLSEKGSV